MYSRTFTESPPGRGTNKYINNVARKIEGARGEFSLSFSLSYTISANLHAPRHEHECKVSRLTDHFCTARHSARKREGERERERGIGRIRAAFANARTLPAFYGLRYRRDMFTHKSHRTAIELSQSARSDLARSIGRRNIRGKRFRAPVCAPGTHIRVCIHLAGRTKKIFARHRRENRPARPIAIAPDVGIRAAGALKRGADIISASSP